jgi:3-isopropylmalate/(R)-2-methylmalate dehydratase large subunit
MGMTMAEKIMARASGRECVQPGEFVTAQVDLLMGHDLSFFAANAMMISSGRDKVWDRDKIAVVIDHFVPPPNSAYAEVHKNVREAVERHGINIFYDAGRGICHQVLPRTDTRYQAS